MSFSEAVRTVYRKYATFEGRATRPEFWWFTLFYFVAFLIGYAVLIAGLVATRSFVVFGALTLAMSVFGLVSVIPSLAVMVRRLHDTDRSGWWFWISLIPWVGVIVLLVFLASEGTRGYNRYGPPEGAPPADGYSEYSGWTRAEALARFSEDAQRAAAAGYQAVTQDWEQRGNVAVLRVWYVRGGVPGWPQTQWPPTQWPAPPGPGGGLG